MRAAACSRVRMPRHWRGIAFVAARTVAAALAPGKYPPAWLPALAFVALLPCPAPAQIQRTGDYLAKMDRDGDGRVSLDEYLDWMGYAFDGLDRNRDGTLGADELPGGRGKPVTREQHRQRLAATFRKQDANHDGYLDARELAAPPQ